MIAVMNDYYQKSEQKQRKEFDLKIEALNREIKRLKRKLTKERRRNKRKRRKKREFSSQRHDDCDRVTISTDTDDSTNRHILLQQDQRESSNIPVINEESDDCAPDCHSNHNGNNHFDMAHSNISPSPLPNMGMNGISMNGPNGNPNEINGVIPNGTNLNGTNPNGPKPNGPNHYNHRTPSPINPITKEIDRGAFHGMPTFATTVTVDDKHLNATMAAIVGNSSSATSGAMMSDIRAQSLSSSDTDDDSDSDDDEGDGIDTVSTDNVKRDRDERRKERKKKKRKKRRKRHKKEREKRLRNVKIEKYRYKYKKLAEEKYVCPPRDGDTDKTWLWCNHPLPGEKGNGKVCGVNWIRVLKDRPLQCQHHCDGDPAQKLVTRSFHKVFPKCAYCKKKGEVHQEPCIRYARMEEIVAFQEMMQKCSKVPVPNERGGYKVKGAKETIPQERFKSKSPRKGQSGQSKKPQSTQSERKSKSKKQRKKRTKSLDGSYGTTTTIDGVRQPIWSDDGDSGLVNGARNRTRKRKRSDEFSDFII